MLHELNKILWYIALASEKTKECESLESLILLLAVDELCIINYFTSSMCISSIIANQEKQTLAVHRESENEVSGVGDEGAEGRERAIEEVRGMRASRCSQGAFHSRSPHSATYAAYPQHEYQWRHPKTCCFFCPVSNSLQAMMLTFIDCTEEHPCWTGLSGVQKCQHCSPLSSVTNSLLYCVFLFTCVCAL